MAAPTVAQGQSCPAPRRCATWHGGSASVPATAPWGGGDEAPAAEKAMLLSAVVPGAGQYAQGRRRWIAYVAAELTGLFLVIDRRREGGRLRTRYRDLAWSVAREGRTDAPRADGDFDYYEDLSRWERSGAFDRDTQAPGIQPETDPGTFNGSIWGLARDRFFPPDGPAPEPGEPTYERALEYYESRAYSSEFVWDWSGDPGSWARYGETIEASDDRFRQATLFTGAVVANHLLSAVDAFVSARLSDASGRPTALTTRLAPGGSAAGSRTRLDLTLSFHARSP